MNVLTVTITTTKIILTETYTDRNYLQQEWDWPYLFPKLLAHLDQMMQKLTRPISNASIHHLE